MGTRHLVCVVDKHGEYKVAQYGQWDGYPSGQGLTVLDFLVNMDRRRFEQRLAELSWMTEGELNEIYDSLEYKTDDYFNTHYAHLSRDTGAGILQLVYDTTGPLKLFDNSQFAGHSLFCEWCYVIDLSTNKLEVFRGFNEEPLGESERFRNFEVDKEEFDRKVRYYQVKLYHTFDLSDLPSLGAFLEILEGEERK